jgi:hypothetical protein
MTEDKPSECIWTKIGLLALDKVFFGLLATVFVFWFDSRLQQEGKVVDYQNKLFDRRADAYLDVLQKAQVVAEFLELYWVSAEESSWTGRLSKLEERAGDSTEQERALANGESIGGASSSIDLGVGLEGVIPHIKDVDAAWMSKRVYFSEPVSDAVNDFLRTVCADLEVEQALREQALLQKQKQLKDPGQTGPVAKFDAKGAWKRAHQAYQKLNDLIRARLKLDGIIMG